jgi:signal transduction histidine kinase
VNRKSNVRNFNSALIEGQENLLKAEKAEIEALEMAMKRKDEFLATIAHEFKTPLTVINAAIQTMESLYGSQMSDNVKKYLRKIRSNTFRQLRLVNNLLDITRFNAGHFKMQRKNLDIVFLTRAITESVELYANEKGVELLFSSDIERREMAIDEEKYERILLNLLSNAIKFTPKGKSIHVNVSCKKREAVITVKDEGIGIPEDKLELIFERFGQVDSFLSREGEGTGIGLALVKTLVSGLGGTIAVSSEVGKGSTFTLSLPLTKLREKKAETDPECTQNNRLVQAVAIEFSDIYLD